jgi:uncharacterized repeat protein (TIGR03803 family)
MKRPTAQRIGCLALFLCAAAAASAQEQFQVLFSFDGFDGFEPLHMFMTQGTDGNFYGTTAEGGGGEGNVFKITPTGEQTNLYDFCSIRNGDICEDGAYPFAGVIQASDGNFYGTTTQGGQAGEGAVYRLTPNGVLTTLYSFCVLGQPCKDGNAPYGPLVQGIDGNLYGTTTEGGAYHEAGGGTVFKITLDGTLTTLHSFGGAVDGTQPPAGLIQATDESFYGTTLTGGAGDGGTVFKITSDGTLTTVYNFCSQPNCTDGMGPWGTLVQASDGNFYGPTTAGGTGTVCSSAGCGTVFRLTPSGMLTTLYNFCTRGNNQQCPDGSSPEQGLTIASNGYLVGTTSNAFQAPLIYFINTTGSKFGRVTVGQPTPAGILQGTDGLFYGTGYGGTYKDGTIFSIGVGLKPFVKATPNLGPAGESVIILGTNLTGATNVTFNGTPAAFTVVSQSEITTTVPSGATTGRVKVTTPSGTLTSNLPFAVVQ